MGLIFHAYGLMTLMFLFYTPLKIGGVIKITAIFYEYTP